MHRMLIDPSRVADAVNLMVRKGSNTVPTERFNRTPMSFEQIEKLQSFWTKKLEGDWRNDTMMVRESSLGVVMANGTAIIPIQEVIDYKPSIWSYYGYCTSVLEVSHCFDMAMNDSKVSRIVFAIDSPGGGVAGIPEFANKVYAARGKKKIIAVADPMAASGALWIGAAASKFYVLGSGSVGSIGCLMIHSDCSKYYTDMGIVNTIIRDPERKAEFNIYESLTDAARADSQKVVEQIARDFQTAVARFRNVSIATVQEKFGKGSMLSSEEAISVGLVDGTVSTLDEILVGETSTSTGSSSTKLNPKVALAVAKRSVKAQS